jgi:hypothetical protein
MAPSGRSPLRDGFVSKTMLSEIEHNRRGLVKLMLRLPALRGQLQIVSAKNPCMFSLCGAFEDASSTLDRLRKEKTGENQSVIREYETLCVELEREIIELCDR